MNVLFGEVKDWMDRHNVMIASSQKRPSQMVLNARRPEKYAITLIDEFVDENKDSDLDEFDQALFGQRGRIWQHGTFGDMRFWHFRDSSYKGFRRDIRFFDNLDRNLESINIKILVFQGRNDLEAYLEWEKKVEFIFYYHNYLDYKKVKLVVIEFIDYFVGTTCFE